LHAADPSADAACAAGACRRCR